MMAIVARVKSVWNATRDLAGQDPEGNEGDARGTENESKGNLFECSACGAVFIADDKDACANCEASVEEVPATFTREAEEPIAE